MEENISKAIIDGQWSWYKASIIESTTDPTKKWLVILNPNGSSVGWGGWGGGDSKREDDWTERVKPKVWKWVTTNTIMKFSTAYEPTWLEETWEIFWDEDRWTFTWILNNWVAYQFGTELYTRWQNNTGSTITNWTPVMYSWSIWASGKIRVKPAIADWTEPAAYIIWVATEDIVDWETGMITWRGKVRWIDCSWTPYWEVWSNWDLIYVSPNTAWYLTNVKPEAPDLTIFIWAVVSNHATVWTIDCWVNFWCKVTELDDVNWTPLTTTGQLMVWDNDRKVFDFNFNIFDLISESTKSTFVCWEDIDFVWAALAINPADWKVYKAADSDISVGGFKENFMGFWTEIKNTWEDIVVDISWVSNTQLSLDVWEKYYLDWRFWNLPPIIQNTSWADNATSYIWQTTTAFETWQSFTLSDDVFVNSIEVQMLRTWTPNIDLSMEIYSDAFSTLVWTSTNIINSTTLWTWHSVYTFSFSNLLLSAWLGYFKIKNITWGVDGSNYVRVRQSWTSNPYALWTLFQITQAWAANSQSTRDLVFQINLESDYTNTWKIRKWWNNLVWIASSSSSIRLKDFEKHNNFLGLLKHSNFEEPVIYWSVNVDLTEDHPPIVFHDTAWNNRTITLPTSPYVWKWFNIFNSATTNSSAVLTINASGSARDKIAPNSSKFYFWNGSSWLSKDWWNITSAWFNSIITLWKNSWGWGTWTIAIWDNATSSSSGTAIWISSSSWGGVSVWRGTSSADNWVTVWYDTIVTWQSIALNRRSTDRTINWRMAVNISWTLTIPPAQYITQWYYQRTTNNTPTILTSNNWAAWTTNQMILQNSSVMSFHWTISARTQAWTEQAKWWEIRWLIRRWANAAATVLVDSSVSVLWADVDAAWWLLSLSANTTNWWLAITITWETWKNIQWVWKIEATENLYT